jgi:hypothetical protein
MTISVSYHIHDIKVALGVQDVPGVCIHNLDAFLLKPIKGMAYLMPQTTKYCATRIFTNADSNTP